MAMTQGVRSGRLLELHAELFDPSGTFSVRATLAELDAIQSATVSDSLDYGRLMHLRALVESKAGRPEDSIRHGEEALRVNSLDRFLTSTERMAQHHDIAWQAGDIEDYVKAASHFQQALAAMADENTTESQRLGTKQRLAFCLHEIGRYADALRVNQEALAGASILFGHDSPKLFSTRTNLAQNQYALGDNAAARATLEHLLADSLKAEVGHVTDNALFQLGVLALADGRSADALEFMQRRLALAIASADSSRIEAASRDLAALTSKLAGEEDMPR